MVEGVKKALFRKVAFKDKFAEDKKGVHIPCKKMQYAQRYRTMKKHALFKIQNKYNMAGANMGKREE